LILRASFNSRYAYPEHYRRIDNGSRKGSDSITVTWDVVDFRVTSAIDSPAPTAEQGVRPPLSGPTDENRP
jgi:hypothetical protein